MISTLVIKAVRACNLRCPYCYYINEDTQAYGSLLTEALVRRLYERYAAYARGSGETVNLIWHGGEPLLLGRRRFERILDLQTEYFQTPVRNMIQTNGVGINQAWIDLFLEYNVGVGISLDGLRDTHDKSRFDSHGRGTFDRIIEAIQLCHSNGIGVGVLCVATPEIDGEGFVELMIDLGVRGCDFLVPITNHALQRSQEHGVKMSGVSSVLCNAFRHWVQKNNPDLRIRLFESLLLNALGIKSVCANSGAKAEQLATVAVVETNGDVCMDVEFGEIDRHGIGEEYRLGANLLDENFSFSAAEELLVERIQERGLAGIPRECEPCPARSLCRGSHPGSRYDDRDRSFQHRSAYCDAMLDLSMEVVSYLHRSGLSDSLVDRRLQRVVTNTGAR